MSSSLREEVYAGRNFTQEFFSDLWNQILAKNRIFLNSQFLLKSSTFLIRNCRYLHKGISQNCFIFLFFHFSLNKDVTYEIKKKRRFYYFVKLFLQLLPSLLQMMKILIETLSSGYRGREHLSSFLFCSCFCLNFREIHFFFGTEASLDAGLLLPRKFWWWFRS